MSRRVLVVDDDPGIRIALVTLLEDLGCEVVEAANGREALDVLSRQPVELVLTDLRMPVLDGMSLLEEVRKGKSSPAVVVITAHGSERAAVRAMKAGAIDYFSKPFDADEIALVVGRCLDLTELRTSHGRLEAGRHLGRFMVFESEAMFDVAERVARLSGRDPSVLITGETGVGKELVARALVETSSRSDGPFVVVNAATLTDELAASELFGHRKGAYTGAIDHSEGLFRAAHGGTLFLDEVGDLRPIAQAALLRVLQERTVRPVGETAEIPVDVRVIAATHRDLSSEGGFRQDLYFRLSVIGINVPPLRERLDDVAVLARHFADLACKRYRLPRMALSDSVLQTLERMPWPGNVRQMEHVMESLVALSDGETVDTSVLERARTSVEEATGGMREQVARLERNLIRAALVHSGGNRSAAARELDISRVSLLDKIKKHGLL